MKQTIFDKQSNLLKVLSHPKRIEILSLMRGHALTVGQIAAMSSLRQPTVSQHLMLLRDAGIVRGSKMGKEMYYTVHNPKYLKILELVRSVLDLEMPGLTEPAVTDPVCGMELTPRSADFSAEYGGVRHYFCGKGCLTQFNKQPSRYV